MGCDFLRSGLRDDASIANFQKVCLKFARARARELHVDWQVAQANNPAASKTAVPTTKSKATPMLNTDKPVCKCFLKPEGCTRSGKPKPAPKKEYYKAKGRTAETQSSKSQASSDAKNKGKGMSKGKDKKNKPSAKTWEIKFNDSDNDMPEQEHPTFDHIFLDDLEPHSNVQ